MLLKFPVYHQCYALLMESNEFYVKNLNGNRLTKFIAHLLCGQIMFIYLLNAEITENIRDAVMDDWQFFICT